ncbi:uncharacterized protein LOC121728102 [Aricia agestis]|uniref:uncharacterized protein LOC121728102 n=1 Tax=Aricia agestis TaxID=91739 RepID=UPI001C202879|nr:uncharacterized protein LOC121728102 [Aricia agestis]
MRRPRDAPKLRRFSEIRNPKPELDLRRELLDLNLKGSEVTCWLGEFDERDESDETDEEDFRFNHDIPLQRSISLDRGLDIFVYLQTIGSETTSSATSGWTVSSRGNSELRLEQYRSFEDIPASPVVKSRHISIDVTNSKNVALSVLRESYAGIEESGVSPQIKKLQKTFSFKNFADYKMSARNSVENLIEKEDEVETVARTPTYRDINFGCNDDDTERSPRQRRVGVTTNEWQEKVDLRKDVLKHSLVSFKSCNDLLAPKQAPTDTGRSHDLKETLRRSRSGDVLNNLRKLRRTLSEQPQTNEQTIPEIVVIDTDDIKENSDPPTDTSNLDVVSCSCQICMEGEEKKDNGSFLRRIFLRIVTYKDLGKSIASDERSDVKDREMYHCIINLLRWLLGLWLRHLDHKQNICAS